VWALAIDDTCTWSELSFKGDMPLAWPGFSVAFDSIRDRAVIFGGELENNVWTLALSGTPTWSELVATGTLPRGRSGALAAYDSRHDRLLVFGGDAHPERNDLWGLNFDSRTWIELIPNSARAPY
jgi:hypothetical protein